MNVAALRPNRHRALTVGRRLLLLVLVAPFVAFAVPKLVGASASYVVVSESMSGPPEPTLRAGDVVFVYDTPPDQVQAGDVVTYRSADGETITHRVVEVRDTEGGLYFRTMGDANEEVDPTLVPAERVVGTVEFTLPYIGRVVEFGETVYGLATLLGLAALLVVNETRYLTASAGVREDAVEPADAPEDKRYTVTRATVRYALVVTSGVATFSLVLAATLRTLPAIVVASVALAGVAALVAVDRFGDWDTPAGNPDPVDASADSDEQSGSPEPPAVDSLTAELHAIASQRRGPPSDDALRADGAKRAVTHTDQGRDETMDDTERESVETTVEGLLDSYFGGIRRVAQVNDERLVTTSGELTAAGRLYAVGMLTGVLATTRGFADDEMAAFTPVDGQDLLDIVDRHEAEIVDRLADRNRATAEVTD